MQHMCQPPEDAAARPQSREASSEGSTAPQTQPSKACTGSSSSQGAAAVAPLPSAAARPPADLVTGLQRQPKWLPCRLLYDKRGSELYETITGLESYYPYRAELELLRAHAPAIAAQMPASGVVVELGCGDGSKTAILLRALMFRHGAAAVRFCGVDCSAEALRQARRNLARLVPELPEAQVELVEAEYLKGIREVRQRYPDTLLTLLWLGSSVGNFSASEARGMLCALHDAAGDRSQLLLAADSWKDPETLLRAYHDSQGVSEAFILNSAHHALAALGHPDAGSPGLWGYEPRVNAELQQARQACWSVEMWVTAQRRIAGVLPGVDIEAGERVLVEISRKFTPQGVAALAFAAGLCPGAAWVSPGIYSLSLLLPPRVALERCWADTDSLFAGIQDWTAQPVGLRHPFAFYYGHVAAFARLKMLPQLDMILSRGMDPLVLDPSQCHTHPAVPARWPTTAQLARYVADARQQLLAAVAQGVDTGAPGNCGTADANGHGGESVAIGTCQASTSVPMHALCMALEHERQHQETTCYLLAQQRKADAAAAASGGGLPVLGPSGPSQEVGALAELPDAYGCAADAVQPFYVQQCSYEAASLARAGGAHLQPGTPSRRAEGVRTQLAALRLAPPSHAVDASFVWVAAGQVTLGVDPARPHAFVWDCELGRLTVAVPGLLVGAAPVTVAQFRRFAFQEQAYQRPELWGAEEFRHMQASGHSMPATWSLLAPAGPQGGERVSGGSGNGSLQGGELWIHMPEASYPWQLVADCPAYVSLAEAQAYCRLHGGRLMTEPEWELAAAAPDRGITQLCSGGWEWTASPFAPLPGFCPDPLYPEFASDFFGGSHFVLRGASPYTHVAQARASFRNWYQRCYPYAFAKFRVCRDA